MFFDFKTNGSLILHLSDCSRKLKAKEYRHGTCLNKDMLPGTKIQLIGQINYKYKTVLLWPNNIKIIGGIVPEIGTIEYLNKITKQAL